MFMWVLAVPLVLMVGYAISVYSWILIYLILGLVGASPWQQPDDTALLVWGTVPLVWAAGFYIAWRSIRRRTGGLNRR